MPLSNRLRRPGYILLVLAVLAGTGYLLRAQLLRSLLDLPPFETQLQSRTTQMLPMRDATALATRVYLPAGAGPWPTVLIRDPYAYYSVICSLFARYGYACVHQDVRGRFDSGGEWYPVVHERDDGQDTLQWLVRQPWQDGNIATFGSSYVGLVQWAMIDTMPPEVKTVIADASHGDWYQIAYRNGHFIHGIVTHWARGLEEDAASMEEIAAQHPMVDSAARFLHEGRQWFLDYIGHPDKRGAYWNAMPYTAIRAAHRSASMPVLMSGAWHDFFLEQQFTVFEELPTRGASLFYIRNGTHAGSPDASGAALIGAWLRLSLQWLDRHLRGESNSADLPNSGYLLQDNPDGTRAHHANWPAAASVSRLYLDNLQDAARCDGGRLSERPAPPQAPVAYRYDPAHPTPSRGGSYQFGTGVLDQGSDLCGRADVLSFASGVFDGGLTLLGSVRVDLTVASDAHDSAFTVKIQEKLADGRVLNIREDITSLRHASASATEPLRRKAAIALRFDMPPIQWHIRPGSSLRLDISSSNYPVFNAHPNADTPWSETVPAIIARQQLFGGTIHLPTRPYAATREDN